MSTPELVRLDGALSSELASEWRALVSRMDGSFFQTPEWISSWAETVGKDQEPTAAVWRDRRRLKAVVCLAKAREDLHRRLPIPMRFWVNAGTGTGASDHAGWAIEPDLGPDVAAWLREFVHRSPLLLRNISTLDAAVAEGFGWRLLEETRCPRVDPRAYAEGQIGSSKLRKSLRNSRRRLARAGVEFDWYPAGRLSHDTVDKLFQLHSDRRQMVGTNSSFAGREIASLHHGLVAKSQDGLGPAAVVARTDDRIVGVLYGFMFTPAFSYHQSGWHPEFASLSIGSVLVDEAMRRVAELDYSLFDFLRGPEPYKYRFGAMDFVDRTFLTGSGTSALLIRLKNALRHVRRRPPK